MTKEQSEENIGRQITQMIVAMDFGGHADEDPFCQRPHCSQKPNKATRHKGQVLTQMWRQITTMGESEEMKELKTE